MACGILGTVKLHLIFLILTLNFTLWSNDCQSIQSYLFFECKQSKCEAKSFFRESLQKHCIFSFRSEALEEPDLIMSSKENTLNPGDGSWVLGCIQTLEGNEVPPLKIADCQAKKVSGTQGQVSSPFDSKFSDIIKQLQNAQFKADFLGLSSVKDPDRFKSRLMQFSRQRESTAVNAINDRHQQFAIQFLILLILPASLSFLAMVGLGSFRSSPLLSWTALLMHAICYAQVLLVRDYTEGGFSFGLSEVDELLYGISYASFFGLLIMTSIRTGLSFSRRRPKQNP